MVSAKGVSLSYGPNKAVFRGLTFELKIGGSLYVCGASGSGKTSLVKALCNLVEVDCGEITMPDPKVVVVLCQTPLLVFGGTVAEQIVYPKTCCVENQGKVISDLLVETGLGHLRDFEGGIDDLSKADVQKICLARVLYHKPLLAILDDALDALSKEDQVEMYNKLRERGITLISTGSDISVGRNLESILMLPCED